MKLSVISRKRWGARRPERIVKIATPVKQVVIHHTVTNAPGPKASVDAEAAHTRMLQRIAMDGAEDQRDIAYSFVVYPSGRVHRGRGWGVEGGHTRTWNHRSHAICFAGNFERDKPTPAAIEAAALLIRRGIKLGKVKPVPRIEGHGSMSGNSTACPGKHLRAKLDRIRELVR